MIVIACAHVLSAYLHDDEERERDNIIIIEMRTDPKA